MSPPAKPHTLKSPCRTRTISTSPELDGGTAGHQVFICEKSDAVIVVSQNDGQCPFRCENGSAIADQLLDRDQVDLARRLPGCSLIRAQSSSCPPFIILVSLQHRMCGRVEAVDVALPGTPGGTDWEGKMYTCTDALDIQLRLNQMSATQYRTLIYFTRHWI